MAKWNFIVSGNQLIKELVVTDNDTDPRSESFMQPSFNLQGGKIVMKESGQYKTAIYFSQIGTIGGETPADIEDAYDKLIALVANFNGAGATAQYKFLLSQTGGDDPQTATSGSLTQGVTYEIVAFETGDDFTPSGAPNNDVGTKWIANGVAPSWSNGSEIGWNGGAPFIVGEITPNTFGRFWFERIDLGYYIIISDGEFSDGTIDFGSTNALVPGDAGLILRSNKDVNSIEFTTATPALVYQDSMIIENVTTLYKYTPF